MENNEEKEMDINEMLEISNNLNEEIEKLLGKDFDENLEKIQLMEQKLARNNLEIIQIAKDCFEEAEKLRESSETNPTKERINEIRNEIAELDVQIKETEAEVDRLHEVLVQTKIDSHPISPDILEWNKNYIEVHYPTRLREIEKQRLECIRNLPGFGEPPKYSKNLETVENELKALQETITEFQIKIDQMNADKKMITDFESEIEKLKMNIKDLEEKASKFDGSEDELLREIFQLELDLEILKKETRNDSEMTDQATKSNEEDEEIIDLSTLFKNPNDFPDLMTFLAKAHSKSAEKSKTPNKNKQKSSPSQQASKRKINMSPKMASSSEKRLCLPKQSVARELLPRASKSIYNSSQLNRSNRVSTDLFGSRNMQSSKPPANDSLTRTKSSRNLLQDRVGGRKLRRTDSISNYVTEETNTSGALGRTYSFSQKNYGKKKISATKDSLIPVSSSPMKSNADDVTKTPIIEKPNLDTSTTPIAPITDAVVTSTPIAEDSVNPIAENDVKMIPVDAQQPMQIESAQDKENQITNSIEEENQQKDLLNQSKQNKKKSASVKIVSSPQVKIMEMEMNESIEDLFTMEFEDNGKLATGNDASFNFSGDEFELSSGGGGGEDFNMSGGGFEGMSFDFDFNGNNEKKKGTAAPTTSNFDGNDFSAFF